MIINRNGKKGMRDGRSLFEVITATQNWFTAILWVKKLSLNEA